jgi:hypothetical protein
MSGRVGALMVTLKEPVDEQRAVALAKTIEELPNVLEVSRLPDDIEQAMNSTRVRYALSYALTSAILKVFWEKKLLGRTKP